MENLIWYKKYSMKLEKLEKKKPKDGQRVLICDKYYKTFKISTYIDGCFYDCHTGLHKYPMGAAYYWSSLPKIKEYETNDKKEIKMINGRALRLVELEIERREEEEFPARVS